MIKLVISIAIVVFAGALSIAADEFHFPFANRHTAANSPVMNEYLAFNAYYINDNLSRYLHTGTDFHAPAETNIYHMENDTDL